jgi:hypothetical protein
MGLKGSKAKGTVNPCEPVCAIANCGSVGAKDAATVAQPDRRNERRFIEDVLGRITLKEEGALQFPGFVEDIRSFHPDWRPLR